MGVRAGVVVCITSFLLGSLFTHWIADSLTLWKSPVTDEHLWTAALYYSILTKGPVQILYVLFGIIILGGTTIFWSFNDLEAGNLMFDGGSIFLYGVAVIMYAYSVIPNLMDKFTAIPPHYVKDAFPRSLKIPTLDLASNHLVCSVALTGVLILQAGRWWAELADSDDEEGYLSEKVEDSDVGEETKSSTPLATISP
ncbi:Shr3 amino acid permease chaperone [Suillus clintonianus]|uniref:Shr3 amino acid permease chaperone n=1 Tax=Suillus clintonianus TaxID=1904413 RepID=UPI001B85E028|nr:Shr3 amino acid permease chaperone [Suillus clintonianus]KAG2157388.1 Shr3 amino acid permease chaperone [Suillus clintonianus]